MVLLLCLTLWKKELKLNLSTVCGYSVDINSQPSYNVINRFVENVYKFLNTSIHLYYAVHMQKCNLLTPLQRVQALFIQVKHLKSLNPDSGLILSNGGYGSITAASRIICSTKQRRFKTCSASF